MLEYVPEMKNGAGVLTDPEVSISEDDEPEKKDEIKFESGIQSPEYLTPLSIRTIKTWSSKSDYPTTSAVFK